MHSAASHVVTTGARRFIAILAAALALLAADRAEAGPLVTTTSDCSTQVLEQPFLPWLDPAHYTLVPHGSFSKGASGWSLSGAAVVAENEPFRVRDDKRPAGLRIAAGGSATSPAMCVGLGHPTLRLFARNDGPVTSPLEVEVLYEDAGGSVQTITIGALPGDSTWAPTVPLPVVANLLPLLPGDHTPVAFRFSAPGTEGGWVIDDVFVDPYRKG